MASISADELAAAEALREATELIGKVTVGANTRVASTSDLRRTCAIDDDGVFSMLEEASGALEGLAAKADAALSEADAQEPESSGDES